VLVVVNGSGEACMQLMNEVEAYHGDCEGVPGTVVREGKTAWYHESASMQLRCGVRGEGEDALVLVCDSREISRSTRSVRHLEFATSELPIDHFSCITRSSRSLKHSSLRRPIARVFDATALYMWRSNVLRLRRCSSAGVWRHGVKPRWYSSAEGLPISEDEFTDALDEILPEILNGEGRVPLGMGHSAPG
jgi:hypothetical protein